MPEPQIPTVEISCAAMEQPYSSDTKLDELLPAGAPSGC